MFDPDAGMPSQNRALIYLGACVIAGLRLARERQVNVRVVPIGLAIDESIRIRIFPNCTLRGVVSGVFTFAKSEISALIMDSEGYIESHSRLHS